MPRTLPPLLIVAALSGCTSRAHVPATASPARTDIRSPDAFQPLAASWFWRAPSDRFELCHDGLQFREEIERFYANEPDATAVEVGRVKLLDGDTAAVIEVVVHSGPVSRTTFLYVSKRETTGAAWYVDWPRTRELAESD
jgi:hypothetical protein